MDTIKEKFYINNCKHETRIASLGVRGCSGGYEQYLYDCKKCPGYDPIGEVECTSMKGDPITFNLPMESKSVKSETISTSVKGWL